MKFKKIASILLVGAGIFTLGSCGGGNGGGGNDGNTTRINFWFLSSDTNNTKMKALVDSYNNGRGKEDGVFVKATPQTDISSNSYQYCTGQYRTDIIFCQDRYFFNNVNQGFYVNLDEEYFNNPEKQDLILKDDNGQPLYNKDDVRPGNIDRFRFNVETLEGGLGQDLYALPFGAGASVIYYNASALESGNVNIIHVTEDELDAYNKEHGTNFAARGYAEYTTDYLTGDAKNFKASTNLDGENVVKVFNDRIPMSFKEMNTLSKNFSKSWNQSSPTTYGIANEWWFSHGWAVGGDCAAWDYDLNKNVFTLGDENPSYFVTKDCTINGVAYKAGETVRYNGRKYLANNGLGDLADSLHEIPSQYDQFREFVALSHAKNAAVDSKGELGSEGMKISPTPVFQNTGKVQYFTTQETLMVVDGNASIKTLYDAVGGENPRFEYDVCPLYTFREFEDEGNVGAENIRVIGKDYGAENGGVFEGKVLERSGTKVEVAPSGSSNNFGYAIPANSRYKDAAFKFLQYLCSEEGESYLADGYDLVPSHSNERTQQSFYKLSEEGDRGALNIENYWSVLYQSDNTYIGDWSYFEQGEWINQWSTILNDAVRGGRMGLDDFFQQITSSTNNSLASLKFKYYHKD